MGIREEFEKAWEKEQWSFKDADDPKHIALWAAKWMAERCANMADEIKRLNTNPDELAYDIRQLAKELD